MIETLERNNQETTIRRVLRSFPGPEWTGDLKQELVNQGFTIIESEDPREVIGEKTFSSPSHQAFE